MNKIAVILCVYQNDTCEYFRQMFKSLQNQTFKYFDIFIQQDGLISVELEDYLNELKKNNLITYLNKRNINKGFAYSLNELIKVVMQRNQYSYIARMDSDDICVPDRIKLQYEFMQNNTHIDICGGWIEEFNTDKQTKQIVKYPKNHDEILKHLRKRNPMAHVSILLKIDFFKKFGLYDTSKLNEDLDLWIRAFQAGAKFHNLQQVLVKVRTNNAFFHRRKNFKRAYEVMTLKIKATKIFSLGILGYIYAVLHFILFISPGWIKLIVYKKLRN